MVTLRIWYPSRHNGFGPGSSSLAINSVWGRAYISTRPVKSGDTRRRMDTPTATLNDDIEAEGEDARNIWIYQRLDEGRMLRLWSGLQSGVPAIWKQNEPSASFHMCDMILAAGRGYDVEETPLSSATGRARGTTELATLASSYLQMAAHAEHYMKVEHW